eukprot:scaffold36395_cov24-Prasinocladus_malaysianus.AAC.1
MERSGRKGRGGAEARGGDPGATTGGGAGCLAGGVLSGDPGSAGLAGGRPQGGRLAGGTHSPPPGP